MQQTKPELLVPASSLEVLKTAVLYGADAVYVGGEAFSLRAKAKNFSMEEMAEGIAFAHEHGVKVYVTANILAHNADLSEAREYFATLRELSFQGEKTQPDALIISDPGMFMIAREVWPDCEIHVSTQANNTNYETYLFWWKLGAKRVVSARELSLKEIREIREHIPEDMEIESFIHGSMCISYSGRCLLSNYFTGRDANQGSCTHPCRWKYAVMEESRPGEYLPVYENERGTFLFNSKDLCMIEYVPEMIAAGINSFKIEGRMKTALYVAAVTRTYRKAIDDYLASEETYRSNLDWYRAEIAKCTYRQYSTGFYFGKPSAENQIYDNSTYVSESIYLGIVEERRDKLLQITQRNKFCVGDHVEIMKRDGRDLSVLVGAIYNEEMEPMESAPHAKQKLWVWLIDDNTFEQVDVENGDILRMNAEA
ncbi:MAG: U32 family peptidase [Acetatifactor sp.]|nr:U32 family peptidase [Acetatifactor sp.]